jgi:hypothetical protein
MDRVSAPILIADRAPIKPTRVIPGIRRKNIPEAFQCPEAPATGSRPASPVPEHARGCERATEQRLRDQTRMFDDSLILAGKEQSNFMFWIGD